MAVFAAKKPAIVALKPAELRWITVTGPVGDGLHVAFVDYKGERYTLLRDDSNTLLVYNQNEWSAFIDGVCKDEFH